MTAARHIQAVPERHRAAKKTYMIEVWPDGDVWVARLGGSTGLVVQAPSEYEAIEQLVKHLRYASELELI